MPGRSTTFDNYSVASVVPSQNLIRSRSKPPMNPRGLSSEKGQVMAKANPSLHRSAGQVEALTGMKQEAQQSHIGWSDTRPAAYICPQRIELATLEHQAG